MTDSLANILGGRAPAEPTEVRIIKNFVLENFKTSVGVTVQERQIIITVRGAALAGALRTRLHKLKKLCETDKRLVIRIS